MLIPRFVSIVLSASGVIITRQTPVLPGVKVFSQLDELNNVAIDAAVVVVPTSFHFEVVEYFLKRKIPVFCEKPLVSKLSDAYRLEKILNEKSGTLQVGHSERFHKVPLIATWVVIKKCKSIRVSGSRSRLRSRNVTFHKVFLLAT